MGLSSLHPARAMEDLSSHDVFKGVAVFTVAAASLTIWYGYRQACLFNTLYDDTYEKTMDKEALNSSLEFINDTEKRDSKKTRPIIDIQNQHNRIIKEVEGTLRNNKERMKSMWLRRWLLSYRSTPKQKAYSEIQGFENREDNSHWWQSRPIVKNICTQHQYVHLQSE